MESGIDPVSLFVGRYKKLSNGDDTTITYKNGNEKSSKVRLGCMNTP